MCIDSTITSSSKTNKTASSKPIKNLAFTAKNCSTTFSGIMKPNIQICKWTFYGGKRNPFLWTLYCLENLIHLHHLRHMYIVEVVDLDHRLPSPIDIYWPSMPSSFSWPNKLGTSLPWQQNWSTAIHVEKRIWKHIYLTINDNKRKRKEMNCTNNCQILTDKL